MVRQYTNLILEMVEDGILEKDWVIQACLKYMSDDQVRDMAEANEFFPADPDEEDDGVEDYDGQPDEAQEWADFDPDC